jgi:hypothetical protein
LLYFNTFGKRKENFSERSKYHCASSSSVFKDKIFWIFCLLVCNCYDFLSVVYLYRCTSEQFGLTEFQTGLLMTLNGLLIFALEMPFVGFERKKSTETENYSLGVLLMSFSFTCYSSILGQEY